MTVPRRSLLGLATLTASGAVRKALAAISLDGGLPELPALPHDCSPPDLTIDTELEPNWVLHRDTDVGGAFGRGTGTLDLALTAGRAAEGLFVALYDRDSAGADPKTAGTGAIRVATFKAAAGLAAGPQTIPLTLPAGPGYYYLDLAASAEMTDAVRLATPLAVGFIVVPFTTSFMSWIGANYAYEGPDIGIGMVPSQTAHGGVFAWTENRYPPDHIVFASPDAYGTGTAELVRVLHDQLGVTIGVGGLCSLGGDWSRFVPGSSGLKYVLEFVTKYFGGRFGALAIGINDGTTSPNDFEKNIDAITAAFKAIAKTPFVTTYQHAGGWFGADGSNPVSGFGRFMVRAKQIEAKRRDFMASDRHDYNQFWLGHATFRGRIFNARATARDIIALSAGGHKGPSIVSAARSGLDIVVKVRHDGGSKLMGYKYTSDHRVAFADGVPSAREMLAVFTLYVAGQHSGNGQPVQPNLAKGIVLGTDTLTLALDDAHPGFVTFRDGTQGPALGGLTLALYKGIDFYDGGPCVDVYDDQLAHGIPYGIAMRTAYAVPVPSV
ncbi:MAG: hypothetical protein NVSMB18_14990 [Acetobacteraceae bacterium]